MSIKKSFRLSRGFTLVELLVVIAIIGILATLLLLQLGVARQRARDAKRIADVNQVRTALELFFDDNGSYPNDTTTPSASTYGTCDSNGIGSGGLHDALVPKYLTQLPCDPLNNSPFIYSYAYKGKTRYQISAVLEQWAQALYSDADINSTSGGWTGQTVDGSKDAKTDCVTPSTTACIYDQGQN